MNQKTVRHFNTRTLAAVGMLCALAWGVGYLRIPIVPAAGFLKFDLKDVITGTGALIYGPGVGLLMAVVVSLLEMVTYSESGPIGLIMNILSTGALVCTASLIYSKIRNLRGAVVGLVSGVAAMTAVMLAWNYIITPLYMGVPRAAVAGLLLPAILPFNLLKGAINAALILLLYKPIVGGLRKSHLVPEATSKTKDSRGAVIGAIAMALFVLASCVVVIVMLARAG